MREAMVSMRPRSTGRPSKRTCPQMPHMILVGRTRRGKARRRIRAAARRRSLRNADVAGLAEGHKRRAAVRRVDDVERAGAGVEDDQIGLAVAVEVTVLRLIAAGAAPLLDARGAVRRQDDVPLAVELTLHG